jgi:hypothetical protein
MDINELAGKQIYELKPLESIGAKQLGVGVGYSVLRVPGGWVFAWLEAACFVPFDNEFLKTEKPVAKKPARQKKKYLPKK